MLKHKNTVIKRQYFLCISVEIQKALKQQKMGKNLTQKVQQ